MRLCRRSEEAGVRGESGKWKLTWFFFSVSYMGGLADPRLRASHEELPSILLPVADETDARRGNTIAPKEYKGMIRKAGDGMLPEGQRFIEVCGE